MSGTCSMHGNREMCTSLKVRNNLMDLVTDGRMILRWNFIKVLGITESLRVGSSGKVL
jgi:hypothetical protein